jgi:hypothetical protein
MKQLFIYTLLLAGLSMTSQDIGKRIRNAKWYRIPNNEDTVIYSMKVEEGTASHVFKEDGKILSVLLADNKTFDGEGNEIRLKPKMSIDSLSHYEIKNGMMKLQLQEGSAKYYRIAFKGDNFELYLIKPEDYK